MNEARGTEQWIKGEDSIATAEAQQTTGVPSSFQLPKCA